MLCTTTIDFELLLLPHVAGWPKTPDCTIISVSKCIFQLVGSTSLAKQSLFCAVLLDSCVQWIGRCHPSCGYHSNVNSVSLIQLPVRSNVIFNLSIAASRM